MEPNIESYLAQVGAVGESQGEGDFTLDPRRALEILREQGSAAENAPLFLFRAVYQHTGGARVKWKKGLFDYQVQWEDEFGELPAGAMKVMAEGAFRALSITLKFKSGSVSMAGSTASFVHLEETLRALEPRLKHYPVVGLYDAPGRSASWLAQEYPEGRLELRHPDTSSRATCFVVDGIEFLESATLPLKITVFDDELRCDISLTRIPETDRKKLWLVRARELFLTVLDRLEQADSIRLDLDHLSRPLEEVLIFLDFVVGLPDQDQLRNVVLDKVRFRDVFGEYWSLRSLLQSHQEHGSIYVLPAIPRHCPEKSSGKRPVLHWRGETRRFGEPLFKETRSGAGYVYSMVRPGAVDGRQFLNLVEWPAGSLGLLPLGAPEAQCEVQLIGKRRGSETIYLEDPAPQRLRLVWRSEDELASWDPTPEFRAQVAHLVDQVLPDLGVDEEWIGKFVLWTGLSELRSMDHLPTTSFLETVRDGWVSPRRVRDVFGEGPVSVLEERSASIPNELPFSLLLWDHPVLQQLGFQTREESSAVRKAYWREEGRKRWLERYEPSTPHGWAEKQALLLEPVGEHYRAVTDPKRPAALMIWREGRPLGQLMLSEEQFPKGHLLIRVDDEFPGDQYWSGPDREAVSRLGPWFETMKKGLRKP